MGCRHLEGRAWRAGGGSNCNQRERRRNGPEWKKHVPVEIVVRQYSHQAGPPGPLSNLTSMNKSPKSLSFHPKISEWNPIVVYFDPQTDRNPILLCGAQRGCVRLVGTVRVVVDDCMFCTCRTRRISKNLARYCTQYKDPRAFRKMVRLESISAPVSIPASNA